MTKRKADIASGTDRPPERLSGQVLPPLDGALLFLIVALFLGLAFYQIDLPGLYNDEAMDVVPAMQMLTGQQIDLSRGAGITIGDRTYPLMTSDYQGVVSTYLAIPYFMVFGIGGFAIRAMSISFGLAAVVLTYFVGRAFFNRWAGLAAAFFLAVMPAHVFWSRIGLYVVNQVVPISLAALLFFLAWRRKGNVAYLFGGMFLLGLGLSTKLLFLWLITSLVGAVLLSQWRNVHRYFRGAAAVGVVAGNTASSTIDWRPVLRDALVGGAGLILGAFPLLLYNLQTRGTYLVIRANLTSTTPHGVDNTNFLNNVLVEADAFRTLLDGSYFWFQGGVYHNYLAIWALGGLAVLLGSLILLRVVPANFRKSAAFFAALIFLIFIQSCFTVSGLWATHLVIILPFPQLLAGAAVAGIVGWAVKTRLPQAIALLAVGGALAGGLVVMDLKVDADYHQALARTGGYSTFSDSIYKLAAYLDENNITSPLAGDWGMKSSIQILTQGRVNPREIYGLTAEPDKAYRQRVKELMWDPDNVWIFHVKESTAYKLRLSVLQEIAKRNGLDTEMTEVFFQRDGKGLFRLFKVVPASQPNG